MKPWIALFSQTGSELKAIIEELKIQPDLVYTNNFKIDDGAFDNLFKASHDNIMTSIKTLRSECIITLHGYLRILPEHICNKFTILNGHPGLITMYPELKGKDPQTKVFNNINSYECIGSVIHKVVPEVDAGDIIAYTISPNIFRNKDNVLLDEVINFNKDLSLRCWTGGILTRYLSEE